MRAKPFTITDVGALLGVQRLLGGDENSYNVVCPFCGDERGKCNFVVIKKGEIVNVYHCFHCGAGGNMLTLYADLRGIYGENRYLKSYWMIQEELPMGIKECRIRQKQVLQREKRCREKFSEPVDYEQRDQVYREMLKAELVLSDSYKKYALEGKEFIRAKYYMYISASKNGEQYLDSLGGMAGASEEGSYEEGYFLLPESFVNPEAGKDKQEDING